MKKTLIYLVLIMAVIMAGTVAYVSVNGLLKVFAGAGTLGLLFFTSIEVAKIVATSAIHTYRKSIGLTYTILLSLGVLISMIITSVGIYGFLSTSYKESYSNMIASDNKIELIEGKKTLLIDSKENLTKDISLKRDRISKILEVREQQENRLDSLYAKNWTTTAKRTEKIISDANEDIKNIEGDINSVTNKLNVINDSINSYSLKVIELQQNNVGASKLNTLKYLADVTNSTMDEVMKWFILLLIIIGDPMAVLMIIAFNKIVNKGEDDYIKHDIRPFNSVYPNSEIKEVDEEPNIYEEPITHEESDTNKEESDIKTKPSKITINDIKEVKERGFSVDIPNRGVDKIGSNKEIRGGDDKTIYYKRKGGNPNENR